MFYAHFISYYTHFYIIFQAKLTFRRGLSFSYNTRIICYVEKLNDPEVAGAFPAMIGGKFAALTILRVEEEEEEEIWGRSKAVQGTQ